MRSTEVEEIERRERLKSKWGQIETFVSVKNRIALVAENIVCMRRPICIELFLELVLPADWKVDGNEMGGLKVMMSGAASDPPDWQPHIRTKDRLEALAKRSASPLLRSARMVRV